jgi:hypothetical protein
MANNLNAPLRWLVSFIFFFPVSLCMGQEGGPQIGRATAEITKSLREDTSGDLASKIRQCYSALKPDTGLDKIAYCFGLDYSANQLRKIPTTNLDSESQRYLAIEKVLTRVNRALNLRKIEQAERGPLIAFWTKSSLAMLRNAGMSERASNANGETKIELAKIAVLKLVRDPSYARVSDMKLVTTPNQRGEPTEVVCGRLSELGVGGRYTPSRPFVYFVVDQNANYDSGADD